jgi:hypothetical protein
MKTIDQIRDSINAIQSEHSKRNDFTPRQLKKAGDESRFLKLCIYYLKTNPTEQFINQQRDETIHKIAFTEKIIGTKKPKLLKSELKPMKEQLKMLNYLLSKK